MPTATWWNLDGDKRARIVEAAIAEFGRRGFSAGSLNVVAREAGVAKGSLFQYFDDKLDLFASVCDACSRRIRDEMGIVMARRAGEHAELFPFLRAVLVDWVRYFEEHPDDRALTFAVNLEIDPEARRAVRAVTNAHYRDVLEELVSAAQARGELRPGASRDHLVAMLLLLLPHLALAPASPELDPVLELHRREGLDLEAAVTGFVDVLEAAFAVPAPPSAASDPHPSPTRGART